MHRFCFVITSEKQLREWTATYSVDERGSVLDGLFSFVSGLFSKKEEVKGPSSAGDNVAKVKFRYISVLNHCHLFALEISRFN